ncbi:MAG: DEAD/DEAH box helicase family protein [Fuerstiella sp.]
MLYRTHQQGIIEVAKAIRVAAVYPATVLSYTVPGGGKSWLPPLLLREFPDDWRIGWFVPRLSLRYQGARDAMDNFKLGLRETGNAQDPCRGNRGFVSTHQSLTSNRQLWQQEFDRHPYIVFIDEFHHAHIERKDAKPNNLASVLDQIQCKVLVLATGTLETGNGDLIWGVHYSPGENKGEYVPDFEKTCDHRVRYSRADALNENALVPLQFEHHDGPVEWRYLSSGLDDGCRLSEATRDQESNAVFTALETDFADGLLKDGVKHWKRYGFIGRKRSKLLVVATNQSKSRLYHERLNDEFPGRAFLALSDNKEAHDDIKRFKKTEGAILVTCQMAYEGLDDKDLTHGICLTNIRSKPRIEQFFGRLWRAKEGKKTAWCFVPDDPRMGRVVDKIKVEKDAVLKAHKEVPPPPPRFGIAATSGETTAAQARRDV